MKQVILVTGSGSGIGRAISRTFAKAGYLVVINDIVPGRGEGVLAEIESEGGAGCFIQSDVSDVSQVRRMFETIRTEYGRIDALINNAGSPGPFSMITDIANENWHKTMGVHLNGTFYCMREAARMMIESGSGRIINMASIAGIIGAVGSGEYGAAKAGIISLTKTGAKELGPHKITVNAIAPGMVGTPTNLILKKKGSSFVQTAEDGTPTGQMANPEEIAALIYFLCSKDAANINGQVIAVDGGAGIETGMDNFMRAFLSREDRRRAR